MAKQLTPLGSACFNGYYTAIAILLGDGADPNAPTNYMLNESNLTPLQLLFHKFDYECNREPDNSTIEEILLIPVINTFFTYGAKPLQTHHKYSELERIGFMLREATKNADPTAKIKLKTKIKKNLNCLLIARKKEPKCVFSDDNMPLDIFKIIYTLAITDVLSFEWKIIQNQRDLCGKTEIYETLQERSLHQEQFKSLHQEHSRTIHKKFGPLKKHKNELNK